MLQESSDNEEEDIDPPIIDDYYETLGSNNGNDNDRDGGFVGIPAA